MAKQPPGTPNENISRGICDIRNTYGPANKDLPPILDNMERNLQQITNRNSELEIYPKLFFGVAVISSIVGGVMGGVVGGVVGIVAYAYTRPPRQK